MLTIKSSNNVGPGSYKVDKGLLDPDRGVSIGKAMRKPLTDFQETGTIGPGVYHKEDGLISKEFKFLILKRITEELNSQELGETN